MRTNQCPNLIIVCKVHLHSDIEVLSATSGDVYYHIGQIYSLKSKKLLTVNKTVDLERVLAFRGRIALKER